MLIEYWGGCKVSPRMTTSCIEDLGADLGKQKVESNDSIPADNFPSLGSHPAVIILRAK